MTICELNFIFCIYLNETIELAKCDKVILVLSGVQYQKL